MNPATRTVLLTVGACMVLTAGAPARTPPATRPAGPPATPSAKPPRDVGMIQLTLPPTVELKVLIELVSKRLGINILYDEAVGKKRVSITSPRKIARADLLGLLQNVLRMSDLELMDTPVAGWKTIGRDVAVTVVPVRNVGAEAMAQRVGQVLRERGRLTGRTGAGAALAMSARNKAARIAGGGTFTLVPEARTNQIVVIADKASTAEAVKLIKAFDVPAEVRTRSYRFRHITPERIDGFLRERIKAMEPVPAYQSTIDEASGLLMVTAPPAVHDQIVRLSADLDVESDPTRGHVRFYKLLNTSAADVLDTLRTLDGAPGGDEGPTHQLPLGVRNHFTGPNLPPTPAGRELPLPPAFRATPAPTTRPAEIASDAVPAGPLSARAMVAADENTNTIIVIAPPEVQKTYRELITMLDKRRPQVLIEITLVSLNTSDNFALGIEIAGRVRDKNHDILLFTSFGLSKIDPVTGVPQIIPGPGFNGIMLSPDSVNVVLRALATNARSRVLAAPKLLVNDNAVASLASVSEAPFTSVNASQTVSTTSFAGYASAGTTVTVTPHISEGDYLQLEYAVTLNGFTDEGSDGIPPPRQTDTLSSQVTIPDGHAVVVGGLTRRDLTETIAKVPFLGDIPVLKHLFSSRTDTDTQSTLFVFIRPVILRDDKFKDLKYLSARELELAELPPNYPAGEPMLIR